MVTPSPSANNLIDLQIGKERLQRPLLEAGSDAKPVVALVRPPLMFHERSIGNEIVPSIGLAYINGYLRKFGYEPFLIDGQSLLLRRFFYV